MSIGDGANDVPMILEADIGIGLYGKEGMRAVDNSDLAISQFKFLWQLLFKHGRWNYQRTSYLLNYFFYKNFVYSLFQVVFGIVNGFSQLSVFPAMFLSAYNIVFSTWPIAAFSVNDCDIYPSSDDIDKKDELNYNEAYDDTSIKKFIP